MAKFNIQNFKVIRLSWKEKNVYTLSLYEISNIITDQNSMKNLKHHLYQNLN